jgi:hypothetical protein
MSVAEVSKLPLRERFQIMAAIWADMAKVVDGLDIPEEHLELLEARRSRVENGEDKLLDWDTVKHHIGRR